jgi:hypothetical protein
MRLAAQPTAIADPAPSSAPSSRGRAWRASVARSRCSGTASATIAGPRKAERGEVAAEYRA